MLSWFRSLLAVAAAIGCAGGVQAQAYPSRVITLVVPFAAGGGTDVLARALATELGTRLKQTVVVDNLPGAGGTIAIQKVTNLPADGYTLVLSNGIESEMLQMADPDGARGRTTNLTAIALIGTQPMVLVARGDLGFKGADDLVAAARAKPGTLSLASSGPGTSLFLAGELFKKAAGITTIDVPYKSAPQIVTDLIAARRRGCVDDSDRDQPAAERQDHGAGGHRHRPLARAAERAQHEREPHAQGCHSKVWYGVFGPPSCLPRLVKALEQQVSEIVRDPAFQARLAALSITPAKLTSASELETLKGEQLAMFRRALGNAAGK